MIENKTITILAIDDDVRDNKALELILAPEGYHLDFVTSGKQALIYLKTKKPDLILLDIIMPELDGFTLCEQIKTDPLMKDIPVIFLSARYDYKDVVRGFELGAVDYITKPFNALELSSRIKSQLTLKFSLQELESINSSKDKLFSILSHDLRNPLVSIQSGLRLLEKNTTDKNENWQQIYDHLTKISSSTFHLLNTILDWSKTQMGTIEQNSSEYNLKEMVEQVLHLYNGTAEMCKLKLINNVEDHKIFIDKEMFNIILRNLVANAVKYTGSGGKISVSAEKNKNFFSLVVSDTGEGMSKELLHKVMQFDTRDVHVKSSDEFNIGIGLSLCKEYVDILGGDITATSESGKGSEFTFTIPVDSSSDKMNAK